MATIARVSPKIPLVNICLHSLSPKNTMAGLIITNKSPGYDGCISLVKKPAPFQVSTWSYNRECLLYLLYMFTLAVTDIPILSSYRKSLQRLVHLHWHLFLS